MNIKPLSFAEAPSEVKVDYQKIKDSLALPYLPLFFQFIGPFPEYLTYISHQIVQILDNEKFISLSLNTEKEILKLIKKHLLQTEEIISWRERYKYSPQYYYFTEDLQNIFSVNIKLAYIFISLREAVKGWAVAAKKLSSVNFRTNEPKAPVSSKEEEQILLEDILPYSQSFTTEQFSKVTSDKLSLQEIGERGLEKNILPAYINLARNEFLQIIKKESYLLTRVEAEKIIVHTLPLLPDLIFSPINVVLPLISKYDNYPELLYLLSEDFPTLAAQKMMFSGYLI